MCEFQSSVFSEKYQGEPKVLQYFSNRKLNSTALDAFAFIVKVINHIRQ